MNELKTLKDITIDLNKKEPICSYWTLKSQAIKWIKDLQGVHFGCFPKHGEFCRQCFEDSKIDWIKHFFGITDEDLKEE